MKTKTSNKMTQTNPIDDQIESAIQNLCNLRWSIDYDYDKDCSQCDTDDYHRHCRIYNFRINNINMKDISKIILGPVKDPITEYCIERYLHIAKMYDTDSWEHSIQNGYYGEEIDKVWFTGEEQCAEFMRRLKTMNDREKIFEVLKEEYSFILPTLQNIRTFEVQEVDLSSIHFPNDHYVTKVRKEHSHYDDWPYPLAVCVPEGAGGLKVVDGYHRVTAAMAKGPNSALQKVKVIVGLT